jgi:hypothetical protein
VIILSPGVVQAAFEVVDIAQRHQLTDQQLSRAFPRVLSIECDTACDLAVGLRWIVRSGDGVLAATERGNRVRATPAYEDRLRQAIWAYVDEVRPAWIANAPSGRSRVLRFLGPQLFQVFAEAGLASELDNGAVAFWDELAARARGRESDRNTAVGRRGERLSFNYEISRTGCEPRWVSLDSNSAGYDILSRVHPEIATPLLVEVKASVAGVNGICHISRNEWAMAAESKNYVFDLWAIEDTAPELFARVSAKEMEMHIPTDAGDGCWETVAIPFSAFRERFALP